MAGASISILFNLEMSRGYPKPTDTRWDYEKGNLDDASKQYTLEAARRVKQARGVIHAFLVGATLEQPDVSWLKALVADGHPIGNHTYDHVNLFAPGLGELQPKFRRAPWLVEGRKVDEVLREQITLTAAAFESRVGGKLSGFRSPSERPPGLSDREDLQRMLKALGFGWVMTRYPPVNLGPAGRRPDAAVFDAIVKAQALAEPEIYPSGLIELPISPVTDIHALRAARWEIADFREAVVRCVEHAIATGGSYRFTAHPSCLTVVDPDCTVIDAICQAVRRAGDRAAIVGLDAVAADVRRARA
jgi:peptidoglycan/xylan/chitin deacetylase (PgdA/CDA1 family)